jgi:radical SAM superfamily enzyme YgiQ (UPF0313 family)
MKDMVEYLNKRIGVNALLVIGDNSFGKPSETQKVFSGLGVRWDTTTHLNAIKPDLVEWAKNSGCLHLGFGAESASDRLLKMMHKGFTADQIKEKSVLLRDAGISASSSWIGFIPGETPEEFKMTLTMMEEIRNFDPYHSFGFHVCRAYPKTPFWDIRTNHGLPEPRTLEGWAAFRPEINQIKGLGDRKTERLRTLVTLLFPRDRRLDKRVPERLRPLLLKRAMRARMTAPMEETLRLGFRTLRGMKNLVVKN